MTTALIIFDLDGTLIDSRADLCAAINRMRHDYGLPPLDLDTVSSFIGNGARKLVERSLRDTNTDIPEALASFRNHYEAHLHDQTTLYDGVRDGLPALRAAGWTLAVSSNKPGDWCRRIVRHFGLADWIETVLGGGDTDALKPDPAPLLAIMQRHRASASRTYMVGDHETDLEAARRAGVRSVFVTYGIGHPGEESPDHTAPTFADLVDLMTRGR